MGKEDGKKAFILTWQWRMDLMVNLVGYLQLMEVNSPALTVHVTR